MTRRLLLPLMLLAGLFAAGCWDYRDIENRSMVLGLAIDLGPRGEHVSTVEVVTPSGARGETRAGEGGTPEGGQGVPRIALTGRAQASTEALSRLRTRWGRPLGFGHLGILLLGEEYARRGPKDEFGCPGCHPTMSVGMNAVVVRGRAGGILAGAPVAGTYTSVFLKDMLRNAFDRGSVPAVSTVSRFVTQTRESGVALLPRLVSDAGALRMEGAGVFQDYRLVGWLEESEVQGLNYLQGKGRRGLVEISCPGDVEEKAAVLIAFKKSHLELTGQDRPAFRYRVRLSGVAIDPACPKGKEEIPRIERQVERTVRDLAQRAVRRAQGMKADFLGLGEELKRRDPALRRSLDWAAAFPGVPVRVDVRAKILWRSTFGGVPHRPTPAPP